MRQQKSDLKKALWAARILIILAVLLTHACAYNFDFVEFDDPRMFYLNPHIQNFSWTHLQWMLTDSSYNNHFYTPLLWFFLMLSGQLLGFTAPLQHMLNILMHASAALLFFEVLRILFQPPRPMLVDRSIAMRYLWASWICAIFWALHPLRMEVSGWISARVHLHATIFALAACWAYCAARRRGSDAPWIFRQPLYWMAVILYGLSVFSFPTVITLPVVLGILDFYLLGSHGTFKAGRRLLHIAAEVAPFVLVAAIPAAVSLFSNIEAIRNSDTYFAGSLAPIPHVMAVCYVIWRYIAATIYPAGLAPMYPELFNVSAASPLFIFSTVMVIGISIAAFFLRRRWYGLWCGWLCYLVLIAPYVGLRGRPLHASDRYSYAATMVFSAMLVWLIIELWMLNSILIKRLTAILALCLLTILASVSFHQLGIWRDTPTLFQATVNRLGNCLCAAEPMWRFSSYLIDRDQLDEANVWLDRAQSIYPASYTVPLVRFKLLQKRCTLAENTGSISLAGNYADLILFCMNDDYAEYENEFFPAMASTYRKLTAVIPSPADRQKVMRVLALAAVKIADGMERRGGIRESVIWYGQAYKSCRDALANGMDKEIIDALAAVCWKLKKLDEATEALQFSISLSPDSPTPLLRLAQIRYAQQRRAEADVLLNQVVQRWPALRSESDKIRGSWQPVPATMPNEP